MSDTLSTNLFNEIGIRPKWTAPCTFDRTNAMPIDGKSCFMTFADLKSYIANEESTAYPGMYVAVTSNDDPQKGAYVLMSDGEHLHPVALGTGTRMFKVEYNETDWGEGKTLDEILTKVDADNSGSKPTKGDLIVVTHKFTEEGEQIDGQATTQTTEAIATYVVVMVSDNNGGLKKALLPLAPSRLTGEKSEILSTINENGESEFKIDEIQFEDLYVDDLYVDGNSINTLIPNVQYLKGLEKIDTNDNPPYDSQLIVEKINDIIDRLNYIYQSQTNTPIQSRTHARGNE